MSGLFKSGLHHRKLRNYLSDQLLTSLSTVQNELFIAWSWSLRSYDAIYLSVRRTPTVSELLCISGVKTHLKNKQRFLIFFPNTKHLDLVLNTIIFNENSLLISVRLYQVKTGYLLKAWRLRGGKRWESKVFSKWFKKKISQLGSRIHPFPIPSSPSNFSLSAAVYRNVCLRFNQHNSLLISFTFPDKRYTHPLNIYIWQEQNAALGE